MSNNKNQNVKSKVKKNNYGLNVNYSKNYKPKKSHNKVNSQGKPNSNSSKKKCVNSQKKFVNPSCKTVGISKNSSISQKNNLLIKKATANAIKNEPQNIGLEEEAKKVSSCDVIESKKKPFRNIYKCFKNFDWHKPFLKIWHITPIIGESLIFALIFSIIDLIAYFLIDDVMVINIFDVVYVNVIATFVINFIILFVVSLLFEYLISKFPKISEKLWKQEGDSYRNRWFIKRKCRENIQDKERK